jgi:DNA polymerase III epsilon subunit-like protein
MNSSLFTFFDTETTGLPKIWRFPVTEEEIAEYPHIVQIAYITINMNTGQMENKYNAVIRLGEDVYMHPSAEACHGISREVCEKEGIPVERALDMFMDQYYQSKMLVAHNMNFDLNLILVELERYKRSLDPVENRRKRKYIESCIEDMKENRKEKFYCTMMTTISLCGLKQKMSNRPKFPKLIELFNHQFRNVEINQEKLHDAFNDVILCILCYYKLKYNKNICDKNKKIARILGDLTTFEQESGIVVN